MHQVPHPLKTNKTENKNNWKNIQLFASMLQKQDLYKESDFTDLQIYK